MLFYRRQLRRSRHRETDQTDYPVRVMTVAHTRETRFAQFEFTSSDSSCGRSTPGADQHDPASLAGGIGSSHDRCPRKVVLPRTRESAAARPEPALEDSAPDEPSSNGSRTATGRCHSAGSRLGERPIRTSPRGKCVGTTPRNQRERRGDPPGITAASRLPGGRCQVVTLRRSANWLRATTSRSQAR